MTDYAIRVGDRVRTRHYGPGVVTQIDRVRRGLDTYWVRLDDARLARFGSIKQAAENLTKLPPDHSDSIDSIDPKEG
jgi:hypothetical protein